MRSKSNLEILYSLVVCLVVVIQDAESCRCARSHPQSLFQSAEYVFAVNIDQNLPGSPQSLEDKATIITIFKGLQTQDIQEGKSIILHGMKYCSSSLAAGVKYIITGAFSEGKLHRSICATLEPYGELTPERDAIFKKFQAVGSSCQVIRPTPGAPVLANDAQCLLSTDQKISECQYQKGICAVTNGKCSWDGPGYDQCLLQ